MAPSLVHTLISILFRFGSKFHKYHLLYCKRVGRQSIRHPLNSDIGFATPAKICNDHSDVSLKIDINLLPFISAAQLRQVIRKVIIPCMVPWYRSQHYQYIAIRASFAPRDTIFLLKGPKCPSVPAVTHYLNSRAQKALPRQA